MLRNLEEEAQKQRCDGMVVHVAADVGFYTLNQKRAELSRLETDYEVTVTFEPKEDLKVGDFEIDRLGTRDPASRPKIAALDPPSEPEPEVEDVEAEATVEEDSDRSESAPPEGQQQPPGEGASGEGGRRRRRRRRRGGRGRDLPEGREPQPAEQPVRVEATGENGTTSDKDDGAEPGQQDAPNDPIQAGENPPGEAQSVESPSAEEPLDEAGRRRRRRRRRGRRGGRDTNGELPRAADGEAPRPSEVEPPRLPDVEPPRLEAPAERPMFAHFESRFGEVDEIDTTPRDEPRGIEPNAASTPVWSLEVDTGVPDTTPVDTVPAKPKKHVPDKPVEPPHLVESELPPPPVEAPAPAVIEAVKVEAPAPARPDPETAAQPVKKGWWQRTFKSE